MTWSTPVAGSLVQGTGTSLNIPYPSGISAGDDLIIVTACRTATTNFPTPTGWTTMGGGSSFAMNCFALDAKASGSESGSLNVANNAGGGNVFGIMLRATGGAASASLRFGSLYGSAAALDLLVPALTITEDNCLVIHYAIKLDNVGPCTPPSGFTEYADANNVGGSTCCFVMGALVQTTAANIAETVWDATGTDNTATNRGVTLAMRAAASGSPLILPHRSSGGTIDLSGNFRG